MKINRISPSRYECYNTCHQKYKYKYHLELIPNAPEPFYFTYGKIIHKISELYIENKGSKLISEVASEVLSGKVEIDKDRVVNFEIPREYKIKIPEHLRAVKTITDKMGFEGESEYKFKYDLDPPNGRFTEGVIDRFILNNDKCWIIDYKTTKPGNFRKNFITITTDVQLRTYARIIQKQFNIKPENIKVALYYLEGANLVPVKFSEQSLDDIEKLLLKTYLKIENQNPDQVVGNVDTHCKRCEYSDICPFYKK